MLQKDILFKQTKGKIMKLKEIRTPKVREDYYEFSDGIGSLRNIVLKTKDDRMNRLFQIAQRTERFVKERLDELYPNGWD